MGAGSGMARWAGWAVLALLLLALARESALRTVDFPVYHRVARELIAGDRTIYPLEAYDGGAMPSHGFRYAPVIAFLMIPIGWLPLEAAAILLYGAKLLAAGYVGSVIARRARMPHGARGYLVAAFLLVGGYVAEEFRYGNIHFLTVALMVFAFDAVESGGTVAPAVALGLAVAAKVTPLALLAYFAVRRRVAVCLATVAVLFVLALLPSVWLGLAANARLLRAFSTYALQKVDEQDNYALRGVLVKHLTATYAGDRSHLPASLADVPPSAVTALWLIGLVVMGLAALAAVLPESRDPAVRLLELSIVVTGILLAAPHTQRRYFVSLFVPAAVLMAVLATRRPDRGTALTAWVGLAALAASGTILPLVFGGRRLALLYEAASPYFFGTLVLYGSLIVVTLREKRAAVQPLAADNA